MREIDWVTSFITPIAVAIIGFFVALFARELFHSPILVWVIAIGTIILIPVSFISNIKGFVVDVTHDTLTYPFYVLRLGVKLTEIADANCQTVVSRSNSNNPL